MSLLQNLTGVEWQGRKHPEDRFGDNNQKIYFYRPQGKGVSKGAICLQRECLPPKEEGSASRGKEVWPTLPPPSIDHLVVATAAVGTHPTGMHFCYFLLWIKGENVPGINQFYISSSMAAVEK